ncbi:putative F-box/LRR-repeat protein At3g59160 isoform X2 [Papaver somniferum]|nr:putative F-box/LRR-repeat protein At3g59160 isoform X2 [Papaver somniferum]
MLHDEDLNAQLFSNSPVLEELMLSNCYMMITKVLHISVASLKRLFITNSKMYSCKLNIYAPNLQSLTYNGMPEGYANTEHVFSSVVDAHIDITDESRANKNSKRQCGLKKLVEGISSVKILHISGSTLTSFFWGEMNQMMPIFHDLRRLDVSSKLSRCMFYALLNLLLKVPNLESVVIAQGFSSSQNYHDLDTFRRRECVLQQQKAVEVREIDGKHEDLDMIKFVLRNSPALQKMTIAFLSGLPQCRRDRVTKKILMLPKVSTCSLINFLA